MTESGIHEKYFAQTLLLSRFNGMRRKYSNKNSYDLNLKNKIIRLENIRDLFILIIYAFGFSTFILICELIVHKMFKKIEMN
jgi:hypothetical protein